jgi:hypothetical protein
MNLKNPLVSLDFSLAISEQVTVCIPVSLSSVIIYAFDGCYEEQYIAGHKTFKYFIY